MKTIIKLGTLLLLLFAVANCGKDDTAIIELDPVQEEPTGEQGESEEEVSLESIFPLEGPKETLVTITGTHFGEDPEAVTILINDKEMEIVSIDDNEIQFEVLPKTFTGVVEVRFSNQNFFPGTFEYEITTTVSTLAGSTKGNTDGFGANAQFNQLRGIILDKEDNLYVVDSGNHRIRKVSAEGEVSTYTGSQCGFDNGRVEMATFCFPYGIFQDAEGSLFVADSNNNAIRKIDRNGNVFIAMRDFQNEQGETERLNNPADYVIDSQGNIYIADSSGHRVLKRTPEGVVIAIGNGNIGDVDGNAQMAEFSFPSSLVIDENDYVFVADRKNDKIRKIAPNGTVSTFAGGENGDEDGMIEEAMFNDPTGIAMDARGSLYVADYGNHKIRKISPDGRVTTLTGGEEGSSDGILEAQFSFPYDLTVNPEGTLIYVSDLLNYRIRKMVLD